MTEISQVIQSGSAHVWLYVPVAIALGALHGLEPGHSKTMMAAFIIAIRGTMWQAVLLGLSAAVSHSLLIWVLAALALNYGGQWNAEHTEPYFHLASAVMILGLAVWMWLRTRREVAEAEAHAAAHGLGHEHGHDHAHEKARAHGLGDGGRNEGAAAGEVLGSEPAAMPKGDEANPWREGAHSHAQTAAHSHAKAAEGSALLVSPAGAFNGPSAAAGPRLQAGEALTPGGLIVPAGMAAPQGGRGAVASGGVAEGAGAKAAANAGAANATAGGRAGPHGGSLLDTGHGWLEVCIADTAQGGARFRIYPCKASGEAVPLPKHTQLALETARLDGSTQKFAFEPRPAEGCWEATSVVPQPHEFLAVITLGHSDHAHTYRLRFAAATPGSTQKPVAVEEPEDDGVEYQDAHERAHAQDIARRFSGQSVTTPQIVLFGITGGLMPCPAAFTVLLVCLQVKKVALGFGLVAAFSFGLALTMVVVGVFAAWGVKHAHRKVRGFGEWMRRAPYLSCIVLVLLAAFMAWQGWQGLLHPHSHAH